MRTITISTVVLFVLLTACRRSVETWPEPEPPSTSSEDHVYRPPVKNVSTHTKPNSESETETETTPEPMPTTKLDQGTVDEEFAKVIDSNLHSRVKLGELFAALIKLKDSGHLGDNELSQWFEKFDKIRQPIERQDDVNFQIKRAYNDLMTLAYQYKKNEGQENPWTTETRPMIERVINGQHPYKDELLLPSQSVRNDDIDPDIRKQIDSLYQELISMVNSGKFDKRESFVDEKVKWRSQADHLCDEMNKRKDVNHHVAVGVSHLRQMMIDYWSSEGKETEFTRTMRPEIERIISGRHPFKDEPLK